MRRRLTQRHGMTVDMISDESGTVTLHTHADIGPQLERNKQRYDGDRMARRKKDLREVAEIPDVVFMKWLAEDGLTWNQVMQDADLRDKFLRKKLNDPENRHLRTGPERL